MQTQEVADKAAALMPELMQDLEKLVAIPSIAFPGYPSEPVTGDGRGDAGDVPRGRLHQRPAHGGADRLPARSTARSRGRRARPW